MHDTWLHVGVLGDVVFILMYTTAKLPEYLESLHSATCPSPRAVVMLLDGAALRDCGLRKCGTARCWCSLDVQMHEQGRDAGDTEALELSANRGVEIPESSGSSHSNKVYQGRDQALDLGQHKGSSASCILFAHLLEPHQDPVGEIPVFRTGFADPSLGGPL